MPRAAKPKLPAFNVTVASPNGGERKWEIRGVDLEDAAKLAGRKVCLRGYKRLLRTSGEPGGPGWFAPMNDHPRWPFAGPAFKVEPKGTP